MVEGSLAFASSELTDLFSFAVVLPTVLGLIGLGLVVVYAMRNRVEANWAKLFFLSAAAYWAIKVVVWGVMTSHRFSFRFIASFAAIGLAGAFVVEALRLVAAKHAEQQSNPQPVVSYHESPQTPLTLPVQSEPQKVDRSRTVPALKAKTKQAEIAKRRAKLLHDLHNPD